MIEAVCLCGVLPLLSGEYDLVTGVGEPCGQSARASKQIDREWSRRFLYLSEAFKSIVAERDQGALIALRRPRPAHSTAVMDKIDMKPETESSSNRVLRNIAYLLPVESGYGAQSREDSMDVAVDWKDLTVK